MNASAWHTPLVCNLPINHAGPHGVRQVETLPPYVTWPDVDESGLLSTRLQAGEKAEGR